MDTRELNRMKFTSNNQPAHPLANSPRFVRITKAQWEAEQAERYKFAFVPVKGKRLARRFQLA